MSILAGAILHAGPMRSTGQHGFKDEHGAGGLGEEKRNPMMSMMLASGLASSASLRLRLPIHENSSALGQYRHPWGCVYHYVRIKARASRISCFLFYKPRSARALQDVSEVVCGT